MLTKHNYFLEEKCCVYLSSQTKCGPLWPYYMAIIVSVLVCEAAVLLIVGRKRVIGTSLLSLRDTSSTLLISGVVLLRENEYISARWEIWKTRNHLFYIYLYVGKAFAWIGRWREQEKILLNWMCTTWLQGEVRNKDRDEAYKACCFCDQID